jgi:hypothetical protein
MATNGYGAKKWGSVEWAQVTASTYFVGLYVF